MRCLLIITLIATIFSCRKHPDLPYQPVQVCSNISSNVDSVNKYIHGKWNWIEDKTFDQTTFTYVYSTPQTNNYIKSIKIVDSTITFYKNYFIIAKYRFRIVKESDLFPSSSDDALFEFVDIKTGYTANVVPISICSQFLVFDFDVISDGTPRATYKLIK